MSQDTQLSFEFKGITGKRITADFSGGEVTSDAGVLALREIAARIGIIDQITDWLPIPAIRVTYGMVWNHSFNNEVLQIACGYEDADDADDLRTDFATAQFDTLQRRLLKIGAVVREYKTKLHFT